MSDTAQDPHLNDISSLSDQTQPASSQSTNNGKLGKPGISGGESGGWESVPGLSETAQNEEIYNAPETLPSQETGERERPVTQREQAAVKERTRVQPVPDTADGPLIVDKRTGKERTHRVDLSTADPVTREADLKEQKFIEGVESIHSLV